MKYFYGLGLIIILPFTILIYLKAHNSIKIKMLVSGFGFGLLSLILSYIFKDYWKPTYLFNNIHIEDFIYGFLFAGILPGVKDIINNTKLDNKYKINLYLSLLYILILLSFFLIFTTLLKINNIYIMALIPFIIGIISLLKVKGKVINVFYTIIVSLLITIIYYELLILIYPSVIDNLFLLNNVSGIKIINIPLEELLFSIGIGTGCTYTYEAIFSLKEENI